ncbi:atp-dependent rna helicase rhle-related [Holotrichia oblita]|nr:atp-dependent rna helicase rhle-related [Holotrichia oblita]
MILRQAKNDDFNDIYEFVKIAFQTADVKDGTEQDFVLKLRARNTYVPELELVAVEDKEVIGHIMFTKLYVQADNGVYVGLLLAPLAVKLEHRKQGIGESLIGAGFEIAKKLGFSSAFLAGNPKYYGRFGFKEIGEFGIENRTEIPNQFVLGYFQPTELQDLFLSVEWSSGNYPEKLVIAMKNSGAGDTAWDSDKLIGLINVLDDSIMTAYIHYLLVNPAYQGNGIGKELVRLVTEKYKDYLRIVLIAYDKEVKFYQNCGLEIGFSKIDFDLPYAVSIVVPLSRYVINQIEDEPSFEYFHHYRTVNAFIDNALLKCGLEIASMGYEYLCVGASHSTGGYSGVFQHKTAARLAGMGYIGKNALFISNKYGPAVRLGTIATDMPFDVGAPIKADCGDCDICKRACPAMAIRGENLIMNKKTKEKNLKFENLNIMQPILKALGNEGYEIPSPIQQQAIPAALEGRDLLGCAQTGTGKTAAFAVPIIQLLSNGIKTVPSNIGALVLTPTRELAIQIEESFRAYGKYTSLKYAVVFGGVSQIPQVEKLKRGVDVLIATPGRLLDLINQKLVSLDSIRIFVLDEADRMLDMGFIHDVKKILKLLPENKQTLFFSATMPPQIASMADAILRNPIKIAITPTSSTVDAIEQSLYFVDKGNKKKLLVELLRNKVLASVLVFTRTKHGADKVVKDLAKANIRALAIHGNKAQSTRQAALNEFKAGNIRVLVATDIAARGIDIDELSCVINYDLPEVPETYVHRIGRTGRAGLGGIAISFCNIDEKKYLLEIEKLIGKTIPKIEGHSYPMEILALTPKGQSTQRKKVPRLDMDKKHQDTKGKRR